MWPVRFLSKGWISTVHDVPDSGTLSNRRIHLYILQHRENNYGGFRFACFSIRHDMVNGLLWLVNASLWCIEVFRRNGGVALHGHFFGHN